MKRILLCCFLTGILVQGALAQRYFGVATGNYDPLNTVFINPANLAGCSEKLTINLFSVNLQVDNNLGTVNSLSSIISNSNNNNGNNNGSNNLFTFSNRNRFSMLLPVFELRGPAVSYAINAKHTLAITTRVRVFNQFNNFDRNLYNYLTNPNFQSGNSYGLNINGFNWTAQIWSEIGLSYGGEVLTRDKFTVKVGATLRYLQGTGFISLKSKNFDVQYSANSDSLYAVNSDLEYASSAYSPSSTFLGGAAGGGILNNFLGSPIGAGIGADLGVIVEIHPFSNDNDPENHRIKLSASVTDIGAITYKAGNTYTADFYGNGYISGSGFSNNVTNYESFKNYLAGQGFSGDTSTGMKTVGLPTALLLGADYNIYKKFFANLTAVANMANRNNLGNSYYGQVTLTPRFDTRLFTAAFPITYNMLADNVRFGFALRFSGFYIGSDDMMMLIADHQYGVNLYMGGYIPIGHNKRSDKPEFVSHL